MITDFNALLNKCKALPRKRLVVCGGEDEAAQLAVKRAADIGLVSPILVGSAGKIKEIMTVTGLSADVIGTETPEEASAAAVRLVREGEGDILMKGMIDTGALLKAVVNRETGIRLSSLLSHVTVFSVPTLDKLLLATDCAMVIAPDFADKIGIIENAAIVARVLGIAVPKVAVLSASEKVNPKMLSSEEAAALARHFAGREDLIVAGPYALDNVISEEAARRKGIAGGAAGSADVIVFPGIEAGNVFYKTAVYLAGATPAGVVIGARAPIALTSRADSEQAKFYSIALAMVVENETDNSRD
ncbi:MAG: phosphate acyltransferase [Bacillota bacterium]|jgi:phosphate butyryltransferase|nr:phosphate acyltransferase [Bacillota bacterium]NLM32379.1 phosphate butyryltransferase [Acholeplasmataceae bacterium]HOA79050.1 phosphate acyltransferase [Bacilli bacterium]HPZ27672.1 phosphate acyltransferase [Bacilli bacterium]HQC90116.1 phosphate acyltransferase [Bacilli bacterium]